MTSYGYFFNADTPDQGTYLVLPDGHNEDDRIAAQKGAGTNYKYCALFYSDDHENFLPFSQRNDDPLTLVLDKDSRYAFWINYKTYKIESSIENISHFNSPIDYNRIIEHNQFNKAKNSLIMNYKKINIELISEGENSYFRVGVETSLNQKYDVAHNDLVKAIIQLNQELQ